MNIFYDFWTQNDIVSKNVLSGMLADDKEMSDCIIYNKEMLEKFKYKIAINYIERKYIKNSKQYTYEFKPNKSDLFLNDKIEIDFESDIIILTSSAEIQQVLYSEIVDCYFIIFKDKLVEKQCYSAAICKKIGDSNFKLCYLNEKPECLKIYRPANINDEY